MSSSNIEDTMREAILATPDAILNDTDVMRALIAANEKAMGDNIVDLRGIAMERLAARLDCLENTHRSVIAAAYENLAGTNQVHKAVLRMMESISFEDFLESLDVDVADILRVDSIRLVLESVQTDAYTAIEQLNHVLIVAQPGFVEAFMTRPGGPLCPVILRQVQGGDRYIYGESADSIQSEACLCLDFGTGRLPGLLVLGSEDPHQFTPQQGTDLLAFFTGVFERLMRHWLS
ncbi:MAG: DUF484 family protein [Rhodobacteraceae bacterium]|nr:DUF484 family protein [Paracoccaceae bacterium]